MPVVGVVTGGLDFSNRFIRLGTIPATYHGNQDSYRDLQTAGIAVLGYGAFVTVLINFVILAIIIFFMVKVINSLRTPAPAPSVDAGPSEDIVLLRDIRDALQSRQT